MMFGSLLQADREGACFHARCADDRVCTEIAVVAHVQGALCIDAFLGEDPPIRGTASANGPTDARTTLATMLPTLGMYRSG